MSTSETPESFQVKRTLRVYIDRWPQLNEVLKFILNQEAELTAAKAKLDDTLIQSSTRLNDLAKAQHERNLAAAQRAEAYAKVKGIWKEN